MFRRHLKGRNPNVTAPRRNAGRNRTRNHRRYRHGNSRAATLDTRTLEISATGQNTENLTQPPNGGLRYPTDIVPNQYKEQPVTCPRCESTNTKWYDGALGYEAVRLPGLPHRNRR